MLRADMTELYVSFIKMDVLLLLGFVTITATSVMSQSTSWGMQCNGRTGSFPHPDYCNQYIVCGNNRVYVMHCPISLHFNAARGYCDYPRRAGCRTAKESQNCNNLLVCPTNVLYFEFPDWSSNCTGFYVCRAGELEKKTCPRGLNYDFVNWRCTFPEEAPCFPQL